MGDFKITIENKTGDEGLQSVPVNFMLFQIPQELGINSWTYAWEVGKIAYPGSVGPIDLPEEVQLCVTDNTEGNPRHTGPTAVKCGQTYNVVQKKDDDVPDVSLTSETRPVGQIKVINARGNAKPLQVALHKNGKPLLSFKDVKPGDAVYLSVEPAIYIDNVDGSVVQGRDFEAVDESANGTRFKLHPDRPNVTILIQKKPSGEITFVDKLNLGHIDSSPH